MKTRSKDPRNRPFRSTNTGELFNAGAAHMRTSESLSTVSGRIGEYDPWPQGLGPMARVQRIMASQRRGSVETDAAVSNAGTHVRGSMKLNW